MRASHASRRALAAGLLLLAGACGKKDEVPASVPPPPAALRVVGVDLGRSITSDKVIANPTDDFAPGDTVYISIATEGASPGATLKARVTYQDGQLVNEATQTIAPSGPAHTEFHIFKPSGWPDGKYKVEITMDGGLAGSKEFEVKRG